MTAIGPYSQSYMMSHMYSIPDLRVKNGVVVYDRGSIMGILSRTPIYSKFARILQIAQMDGIYNDSQANFTLLIVSNENIPNNLIESLDVGDAKRIVKASSLKRIIPLMLLEDSPATYFLTTDDKTKLFVTNLYGKTMINDKINVLHGDIRATNGMIHVVNQLIIPVV